MTFSTDIWFFVKLIPCSNYFSDTHINFTQDGVFETKGNNISFLNIVKGKEKDIFQNTYINIKNKYPELYNDIKNKEKSSLVQSCKKKKFWDNIKNFFF